MEGDGNTCVTASFWLTCFRPSSMALSVVGELLAVFKGEKHDPSLCKHTAQGHPKVGNSRHQTSLPNRAGSRKKKFHLFMYEKCIWFCRWSVVTLPDMDYWY